MINAPAVVRCDSEYKLLIDGRLVDGVRTIDVLNPATERVVAACPVASAEQLDDAVRAAQGAFPAWSALPIDQRGRFVNDAADAIEEQIDTLAALLTAEQGKPLALARLEVQRACRILRHFAQARLPVQVLRDSAQERIYERRVPLGVVAAIVPWNYPLILLMNKLGPALIAGNCVVAKPAPTTPLTTLKIAAICARVFPTGVLNVICDDNDLGARLTSHPDIAKVSFTGSTATGRKVFQSAAPTLKRLTLELGGNDAAVVLDDADLDAIAPQIFRSAMINSGQVCMAIKRVYVADALYDGLCERLGQLAASCVVGDGAEPGTELGPVQNAAQYEKLKALLQECREQGRVIGAATPSAGRGYFIPPSIVRDVADDARIVCDEQFGPILPVLRYRDVGDAVARINDGMFGLGGSVWGRDLDKAIAVAEQIDSGTVWVNRHMSTDPSIPFRGARQSGIGAELGEAGLHEFTQAQVVNVAL